METRANKTVCECSANKHTNDENCGNVRVGPEAAEFSRPFDAAGCALCFPFELAPPDEGFIMGKRCVCVFESFVC